jgi:hypothetical protein
MGPGLEENLLSQASTYVRNIQTEKVRNYFYPSETSQAGRESGAQPHIWLRNIEKGKKEKNLGTSTFFSDFAREKRTTWVNAWWLVLSTQSVPVAVTPLGESNGACSSTASAGVLYRESADWNGEANFPHRQEKPIEVRSAA